MVGTPKNPPARHKTFGISDSLLDAVRQVQEAGKGREDVKATQRNVARKSGALRSKDSVASTTTARFKQRHAGDTVPHRPGTEGQPRGTGSKQAGSKRPVGGMGAVHYDLGNTPEDEFRRKYGKSKSAMRTGLRRQEELQLEDLDVLKEMHITVQMNPGGTSYKVISVSKDVGGRVKPGETLTDTHIDDLRDMDVSISYKKDGGGTGKMGGKSGQESVDLDAKNADKAIKHDCATHVVHKEHGEGQCIPGQHTIVETSEGEGYVTHYDVMFDSGIHEDVPVEDLEIVKEMSHGHKKKKSVKSGYMMSSKMKEAVDLDADNVEKMLRHDCASHVKHGEFGEGNCMPGQHTIVETSEGEGYVTHYDVMFDHGIEEDVPVEDLEIISESMHAHADKKKKKGQKVLMDKKKKKGDDNGNGNGNLDPVDPNALKGTHADRKDGDIDNDGDEDDSDKFLHKKRKAITKAMKKKGLKEWVAMGSKAPGNEVVKDAREAYQLAQHYLQMANRDALFANEEKEKAHMKLAKQFYEQYKEMKNNGDESSDDTFKNEMADAKIESFSEAAMPQTTSEAAVQEVSRDTLGSYIRKASDARGHRGLSTKKVDNRYSGVAKASKKIDDMENMPKTQVGSPHKIKPSYNVKTHKLVKVKGKPGLKTVPKDYKLRDGEYEAEGVEPQKDSTNLGEHAPEVVEYIPHAYDYNRSSWMDALDEVNRYKGRSGHRVTKPEKEGPEHIVMQMRKVVSLGDNHQGVDFGDGTKKKVGKDTAQKFLDKYNRSKPEEKEKLQRSAGHSHGGLHHAISDKPIEKGPGQPKPKPMGYRPAARRDTLRGLQHPDDQD